jgi:cell division protein ZapE
LAPVPHTLTAAPASVDRSVGHAVAEAYDHLAAIGEITPDPAQRVVATRLDHLLVSLGEVRLAAKGSALGWLFARRRPARAEPEQRGLFIWGGVGRGKTMLMDLFYERVPVERKRRQHFHVFMADVHERVFEARRQLAAGVDRDPVDIVADALAGEIRIICFDEFSVKDIADAMILGRLFGKLFERGVILVATSNVHPDALYPDGINRDHFVPFIRMLKTWTEVVHLGAATDYRLEKLGRAEVYLSPLGREADLAIDRLWLRLTGTEAGTVRKLPVHGRSVTVPMAAHGCARFTFADLCARPLGASDYRAIADTFHTVFLEHVPRLDHERRNEAKRFITLIDTLYDAGVKLVVSAAAEPGELYSGKSGAEAFEFARTASRLIEMRSEEYISRPRRETVRTG